MRKLIAAPAAAFLLAAVLSAAVLTGCTRETAEVPAEPPAAADHTAGRLSEDTRPDPGGTSDAGPSEPALTMEALRAVSFSDVPSQNVRADFIRYAACRGLLQETDEGAFSPEAFAARGELMSALRQLSGQGAPAYDGAFADVSAGDPWADAVTWAVRTGVAAGTGMNTFSPGSAVSRSQLAVFLYRLAGPEETGDASLAAYRDGAQVPAYARRPLAWALQNRLLEGMVSDTIYPKLPVSREQLAQVLTAYAAFVDREPLARSLMAGEEPAQAESVSRARHEEIQKQVEAAAAKYGAMGMQVAVVENGTVTDSFACGWALRDTVPMTADHKIRAASLTKVAVGMAAMILREEGTADLDESIGTYWGVTVRNPSHPEIPVSIRSLLSHTSSLKVFGWETSRAREDVRSCLQSGSSYMRAAPGSPAAWGYNNYAFGVLGQTLELASGKYLDEIMEDRLWSVMDIDAAFESGSVRETDRLATLYEGGKVYTSHKALLRNVRPSSLGATGDNYSGGMTISAPELARMAALLVNDGCYEGLRLLSEESVALLESDSGVLISDGSHQAMPLRWRDGLYGRERLCYHTGSGYGVYNLLTYDPVTRDAVVVLTTGASGTKDPQGIYAVCGEITQYIYDVIG